MFAVSSAKGHGLTLAHVASYPHLRALAWSGNTLYASSGYRLLRADMNARVLAWEYVGHYDPGVARKLSSSSRLGFRLLRDGFHALAVLPTGHLVAAVPGAIVTLASGDEEFRVTHRVARGTRPLHIAVDAENHLFWGEYFDNPDRKEVHIHTSSDCGATWQVCYTFPSGTIRHVHNVVYDQWENCLWILTGDEGAECRMLRASCDFSRVEVMLSGYQQARAVALIPTSEALYFSSDTPLEANHVYRMERDGKVTQVAALTSSSIYGCRVGDAIFFSTMVEPSEVNHDPNVRLFGSADGQRFEFLQRWPKDMWHMGWFQYGNAVLPDGRNTTRFLAASTIAVEHNDLETSLWRVSV